MPLAWSVVVSRSDLIAFENDGTLVKYFFLTVCNFSLLSFTLCADDSLVIYPNDITLNGPDASQQLICEELRAENPVRQLREDLVWSSSDDKIVRIEKGIIYPVGDGAATITAKSGNQTAIAKVTVQQFAESASINFRYQVQAVLSKSGCNSGACHGAALGKNGLRLSLRGYDSDFDYHALTRQVSGRRVNLAEPARSLLVTKPTGAIPHKGGVRFEVDSPEYNVLVNWIAQGAEPPRDKDPQLEQIELFPARALLQPNQQQQFVVRARYSDGHTEDVTRFAKFTSTAESVGTIDQLGLLKTVGSGEGAVSVWFASRVVVAPITVPYQQKIEPAAFAASPRKNLIDEQILFQLQRLNLPPSPQADDAEFLRRAFLDTIGVLPTVAEAKTFLEDKTPDKRNVLIDRLLARPEFVDYWTYRWSDLLLVNSEKLKPNAMWAYYRWIRTQVEQNTPWDQFSREVLTATGSTLDNGAANFFVLHPDATELMENTSQAFLGMAINCAKCHNHPLEKWTNDQYYALANMFSRVKMKDLTGEGNTLVISAVEGDLIQPRTGRPQPPAALDATPFALTDTKDRRAEFAAWLTAPENPYFARAIVNRVWANFMTVGLVEAVDDLRLTNPASNEVLLNALADYLKQEKYDLKKLMRLIMQSAAYQRSSTILPENAVDRRFYSRYYPKRMMAEVLLDSISQVTGVPTDFDRESGDRRNRNLKGRGEMYPTSLRAIQLPDSNVYSYFLKSFGRAQRLLTCECERTDEPSMIQVLHLANGETINEKLADPTSIAAKLHKDKRSAAEIVETAYLGTLTRYPSAAEKAKLLAEWERTAEDERRPWIEDLYWSLLSSKEFLLNH
jgi:hypothetical protein